MNGILLIDKPEGWTSHDIAAKLKGMLRERRIGHSGTLDPMATGLLVMFVGRATRAVEFAEAQSKRYIAGLRLGVSTDTQDTTKPILMQCSACSPMAIVAALAVNSPIILPAKHWHATVPAAIMAALSPSVISKIFLTRLLSPAP